MQIEILPIFRSPGQARLLTALLVGPDAGWRPLTQLAREAGLATSSVMREVERLKRAGLVESRRIGNVREVRADDGSRFAPELRGLLTKAFGPVPVLTAAPAGVEGIREAFVFDSWARRELDPTAADEAPHDIDLLVVGDPDPGVLYRACAGAEITIGLEVAPTILAPEVWDGESAGPAAGFVEGVRAGALIPLPLKGL